MTKKKLTKKQINALYEKAKAAYYELVKWQQYMRVHNTVDIALPEKKHKIQAKIKTSILIHIRNATPQWEDAIKELKKADELTALNLFREVYE